MIYSTMSESEKYEIQFLTRYAIDRLDEEDYYPGDRIEALLQNKVLDRVHMSIFDSVSRLIGEDIHDFFFNPVIRYKSICAQIIRWGVPHTETTSRIFSYKVGEALGAVLKYPKNEAPSTEKYIVNSITDFEDLTIPDVKKYLEKDKWLVKQIVEQFGKKLGIPCSFMYPPFSWVATYLRDVNILFQDLYDQPEFVHRMCRFATDLELQIISELTEITPCAFFMPGGLSDMLSPDLNREFNLPYMAELMNKNPECIFYLPVPGSFRQINEMYELSSEHKNLICMGSSIGEHTPIKSEEELIELCNMLDSINRPYQLAVDQYTLGYSSPKEIIKKVDRLFQIGKIENMMFRTDTIDPSTPHENIDAYVWAVKNNGVV